MPKKVAKTSLDNLKKGGQARKKQPRVAITPYVLPRTKTWLGDAPGAIGEYLDAISHLSQNIGKIMDSTVQLGRIRLVNPDRGWVWVANLHTESGVFSARTGAFESENFNKFDLYLQVGCHEYWCGRSFSRNDLARWFAGEVLPADDQPQTDELGTIPANVPNPQDWKWYSVGSWGEKVLSRHLKPTAAHIQELAGYALTLHPDQFYPLLDLYEVWVCDKDTDRPLALVQTGTTLDEADGQMFSPMWRSSKSDRDFELEKRVNDRINLTPQPGRFSFKSRLFKRNLDGTVEEYGRESPHAVLQKIADHPPGFLPDGAIALEFLPS